MNSIKSEKQKILITGGNGFLGRSIIRLLIKNNYEVISFSRTHSIELEKMGIAQIHGNLEKINDIKSALREINAVIHTASKVGMNGTYQDFYSTNVMGTKNLIQAMKEENISTLVYTSTPSVVFGKDDLIFANESTPYPETFLTHYAQTKMLAEKLVLESCNENFHATALRPHLIFGPGDLNLIPRIIESRKKNKLKIVGTGLNLVDVIHVENAALAHLFALSKLTRADSVSLVNKKAYFIGQGPVNLWAFINEILMVKGLPPVTNKIPLKVAYILGFIIETFLNIFGRHDIHPPMSRFIALQLGKSHYFDHQQSLQDLGDYQQINLADAIKTI